MNNFENEIINETEIDDGKEVLDVHEKVLEDKSKVNWTNEQKDALDIKEEKNLLVSASAGSGKTAVMTQRIINLVTEKRIPISNFLVVTFTSASAQDMKSKILKKFQELPADPFILEQIDAISTSDISDLHSFYSRLISTYFYEIEVDPAYHIIDEVESSYLKDKAMTRLFEQKEKQEDKDYFLLFDIFQKKRKDEKLRDAIFSLRTLLDSQVDGEKWFFEKLEETYSEDFDNSICVKTILDYIEDTINVLVKKIEKLEEKCNEFGFDKYYDYFVDFSSNIRAFSNKKTFEQNANIYNDIVNNFKKLPSLKNKADLDGEAFAFANGISDVNDSLKKEIKAFANFFSAKTLDEEKAHLRQTKEILKLLYNITAEFSKIYDELKKEANGLDFNDLERNAYKILSNPKICEAVKSKYKYIFVDEYQDINTIQEKIISMISSEKNRFMVGDLKQSIYRFRLCDPEIFLDKYKSYSKNSEFCKVVKLNKNFRSDKNILKFVDMVFAGTMTEKFGGIDYEKESMFTAGEKNTNEPHSATLCLINTQKAEKDKKNLDEKNQVYSVKNHIQEDDVETKAIIAEAKLVSQKISEILDKSIKSGEKVSFSDFAVLVYSRNMKTSNFIETLEDLGVPVSSDEKIDLMDRPYIQEIVNFIKFVNDSRDDYLLFKVLKSRMFNFSDSELVKLRKINFKIRFFDTVNFYEYLEDENLKQKVKEFFDTCKRYSNLSKTMQVKDFVKLLVKDFKLTRLNLVEEEGVSQNEILSKFIASLPNVSVGEFLVNYSNFSVKIQNECGGDAVKIMTIHRSKGLEFKYVFLINNSNEINYSSVDGKILFNKNFGVGLDSFDFDTRTEYTNIAMQAIKVFEKKKIAEEQQRVLYVALTRAISKLFVICSQDESKIVDEFPVIPRVYLDWFNPLMKRCLNGENFSEFDFESYTLDDFKDDAKVEKNQLLFKKQEVLVPQSFSYDFVESVAVPLKNSVSKILSSNGFETVFNNLEKQINSGNVLTKYEKQTEDETKEDLNFASDEFEDDVDDDFEMESLKLENEDLNFYMERGTAYHKILQNIDFYNLENIDEQLETLSKSMEKEFELVNIQTIKKVLNLPFFKSLEGFKILKEREFFANVKANLINSKASENDTIILQGVIDFLAVGENEIYVLDYKTGKKSDEKLEKYKFQIDMYADICERIFNKKVTKKIICFIDEQNIIEL